jgi:ubiquinone/menaquinone biosynthesis C-methylase UbiE
MYTAVATAPDQEFHFPTGRAACQVLGYPQQSVESLPEAALESFAGVGYPFAAGVIREGDHVLDIGSGSGTDALICANLVGATGRVFALDMTAPMRAKLQTAATAAEIDHIEILEGDAETIPLSDAAVDVVTSNGVLNLVPDKPRAIAEIYRVLKPGGCLQIADIALSRAVSERFRQDPQMWAECVVGAVEEDKYLAMLRAAGFEDVERIGELDYFALSTHAKTREVAQLFNAHSIALRAEKPRTAAAVQPVSTGRATLNMLREFTGVAAAIFAWLVCAGFPAVVATLSAIGAGGFATHAYMFPAYAAFLGLSVWLIWRSGRLRGEVGPFRLALASSVFAVASTWVAIVGIAPVMGWWSYLGVAGLVAASVWSFVLARRPGDCAVEMVRDAQLREQRGTPARRFMRGALASGIVIVALYGLHVSINGFV